MRKANRSTVFSVSVLGFAAFLWFHDLPNLRWIRRGFGFVCICVLVRVRNSAEAVDTKYELMELLQTRVATHAH